MTEPPALPSLPELKTTDSVMFDRWVARSSLPRAVVVAGIFSVLLALPLILGRLSGVSVAQVLALYRAQLVYPVIIAFILVMPIEKTRTSVALSLRPLIRVDDDTFVSVVNRSCRVRPLSEVIVFGAGMLVGLAINIRFEPLQSPVHPLEIYAYLSRIGLFGFVFWGIFLILSITRTTNVLLRLPTDVDIFHLQPFAAIGRQSVWLSLTLVGAVTISLFSASFGNQSLWMEYFIVYSVLLMIIVLLFFLNTRGVHRLLACAKNEQLASLEGYLADACDRFEKLLLSSGDTHSIATEITALAVFKQEVKLARTWPYNTQLLRTAAVSVVTPAAVGLSRLIPLLLTGNLF